MIRAFLAIFILALAGCRKPTPPVDDAATVYVCQWGLMGHENFRPLEARIRAAHPAATIMDRGWAEDWAASLVGVNAPRRVCVSGDSLGATKALAECAKLPHVDLLILADPVHYAWGTSPAALPSSVAAVREYLSASTVPPTYIVGDAVPVVIRSAVHGNLCGNAEFLDGVMEDLK